jgi:hypothetical protein
MIPVLRCSFVGVLVVVFVSLLNAIPLSGPKRRIAILDFKDKSGGPALHDEWVGTEMADRVGHALKKSGACVVLDRDQLTNASLIITGSVTQFSVQEHTARCALDLRVVDTTTGEVLVMAHITGNGSRIEAASHQATDQAVTFIEKNLDTSPWYGRIVKSELGDVRVNTGVEDGRRVDQEFDVLRPDRALLNPETGEIVSAKKTPIGRIRLVAILGPRLARAVRLEGIELQAGDVIQ